MAFRVCRFFGSLPVSGKKDRVILSNLVFHGYHGVYKSENELGQKFVVDVSISTDFRPLGVSDDIKKTIDYGAVFQLIQNIVQKPKNDSKELIETLANTIAKEVLTKYDMAQEITVLIKKPQVAVTGVVDYLGIEVTRAKSEYL